MSASKKREPLCIHVRHWRRFQRIGGVLGIPAVICVIFARDFPGAGLLRFLGYAVILTIGVSGALMALAQKAGFIHLVWDEESRKSLLGRMHALEEKASEWRKSDPR